MFHLIIILCLFSFVSNLFLLQNLRKCEPVSPFLSSFSTASAETVSNSSFLFNVSPDPFQFQSTSPRPDRKNRVKLGQTNLSFHDRHIPINRRLTPGIYFLPSLVSLHEGSFLKLIKNQARQKEFPFSHE